MQTCTANLSINRKQNKRGRTVSKILCPVTQTEYIFMRGGGLIGLMINTID